MLPQITTILDLLGLVLVVAGLSLAAGLLFAPAGFAVAGLGLLGMSWLLDYRAQAPARAARKAAKAAVAGGAAV